MRFISQKVLFMLLAATFSAAGVSAYTDDSLERISNWGKVSDFQKNDRRYILNASDWLHLPGNKKKTLEEFEAASGMQRPDSTPALQLAWQVVQANATDDLGFIALSFVFRTANEAEAERKYRLPALALLERHYVTDPRIEKILVLMRYAKSNNGEAAKAMLSLVEKVVQQNKPGSRLRVLAAYHFASEQLKAFNDLSVPESKRRVMRKQLTKHAKLVMEEGDGIAVWRQPATDQAARLLKTIENLSIGRTLPNAKARLVGGGGEDQLENYRGKVVLLDFWATWCVPCVANLPKVIELKKEMKGKPFEVIAISIDDSDDDVIEFMKEEMALPVVNWRVGRDSPLYKDWNIKSVPTYFLIDEKGTIHGSGSFNGMPERARELVDELTGK